MMRIKTIAMIGAGNVGAYIVRGFAKKLQEGGIDGLWIIAEGARKERLERDGLVINGEPYTLDVRTPEEAAGADLIIVGVKYQALREILPAIRTIAKEDFRAIPRRCRITFTEDAILVDEENEEE
ncbi:MAG: NAD(P)-binding domain-containing protein [Firmicutes bacterium]|nr:NAD(P)-binding domain-containing protein [Bacillota bacterium]